MAPASDGRLYRRGMRAIDFNQVRQEGNYLLCGVQRHQPR